MQNEILNMIQSVIDNFESYTYSESLNLLKRNSDCKSHNKIMVLFVGANGSGKSTFIANLIKKTNFNFKYLNADIFAVQNGIDAYASMLITMHFVKNSIKSAEDFVYETVFSHISKLELVNFALANGYKIITVFVTTDDVNINIERVKKRALQGGHNVDTDKIINRNKRTAKNVKILRTLSDYYIEFNNSKEI